MSDVLSWGLDVVRSVQTLASPGLTTAMKIVSLAGSMEFYIAFLPLVYWCVDRRKGVRLGITLLVSAFLNLWLKALLLQPRPYQLDQSVMLDTADSWGLPSGHAQGSAVFWGSLAILFKKTILIAAAIVLPLLVGFSRVYLGVHFPTDVFAGWGIAVLCLTVFFLFGEKAGLFFRNLDRRYKIIAVAAIALGMNFLMKSDSMPAGAFLGAGIGFVIVSENLRFSAGGSARMRILRYLAGMTTTLLVYLAPKYLIGDMFPSQAYLIRFIRYAAVGGWTSLGAPWLFLRLKLAVLEE
ncbi:MAG: phosphatase PAP2 family protein [Rectinemataceae bacterium]|nr:phosphatase PAP2 family protein [Rectinemataceae bacterium]